MDALLDHPFFAAEAGFRRNKQVRPAIALLFCITRIHSYLQPPEQQPTLGWLARCMEASRLHSGLH